MRAAARQVILLPASGSVCFLHFIVNILERKSRATNASARLRKHTTEILAQWEARVRSLVPAARHETQHTLRGSIPDFLVNLTADLSSQESGQTAGGRHGTLALATQHGKERAGMPAYSLEQMLLEYHLLRRTIFQVLLKGGPIQAWESEIILDSIDRGITEAGEAFAVEKLSAEKKSIQLLQRERDLRKTFISTLTHDLRGPLTAVHAWAQLVHAQPEKIAQNVDLSARVVEALLRMDRMIRDLLDVDRIRSGAPLPLHFDRCQLRELLTQILEEMGAVHGKRIVFQADDEVTGFFSADGLKRLVENLVSNAIKYGDPDKPVSVLLRLQNEKVLISVHNEGNPLTAAEIRKVFEPFHQAWREKRSEKSGWGLGLTVVQGVVEAHHGSIRVESAPGKGTTFIVELPRDFLKKEEAA